MSSEQRKIMEFLVQYEGEKWNNGKWSPKVSQIIQHMKSAFDWKEQYTQGVLSEMKRNGMIGISK